MSLSVRQNWYNELIEDCRGIITEGVFNSNWYLIETYHAVGKRILQDYEKFQGADVVQQVAQSLGKSKRTIYQAVQFARMYPDLTKLPEGKNTNWHRICNKYLTKNANMPQLRLVICPSCGFSFSPSKGTGEDVKAAHNGTQGHILPLVETNR